MEAVFSVQMRCRLADTEKVGSVQRDCMLRWMNLRRQRRMCGKGLRSDDGGEGTKAQTKGNNV
jgi:hypothetical protein